MIKAEEYCSRYMLWLDYEGYALVNDMIAELQLQINEAEVYVVVRMSVRSNEEPRFEAKVRNGRLMIRLTDRGR